MINKKGLTLIEVIVSIAIIGILAVSFLPSLTNHFKWISETKTKITQEAFKSQEDIEENINNIKKTMLEKEIESEDWESLGISNKIEEIKLFEDEFKGYSQRLFPNAYETRISVNEKDRLVAIVGDKRLPELPVPIIETLSLKFLKNKVESETKLEYVNYENLELKAISNMSKNPQNSFNRYRHEWYVSRPGFNIPIPNLEDIDEDLDIGRIYPKFPDDYEAIPIASELNNAYEFKNENERIITGVLRNNTVNKYAGRHILYTITPYAKSLKKGNTSTILPLFVTGPQITRNLKMHLDASSILKGDTRNIVVSGEEGQYYLKKWSNNRISLENPDTLNDLEAKYEDEMPLFKKDRLSDGVLEILLDMEVNFQGETDEKVIGRALGSNNEKMSTMENSYLVLKDNWSIFIIMRKVNEPFLLNSDIPILKSNTSRSRNQSWELKWTSDEKLRFEGVNKSGVELSESLSQDDWHIIEISNQQNTKIGAINLQTDSEKVYESKYTELIRTNSQGIDINWNGVEIAEILVYDSKMEDQELIEIKNYLIKKYNP